MKNLIKNKIEFLLIVVAFLSVNLIVFSQQQEDVPPSSGHKSEFTPEQDSAYHEAMRLKLPLDVQMRNYITMSDKNWQNFIRTQRSSPYGKVVENLKDIPKELFIPSGQEKLAYQENLERSMYVPFMTTLPKYGMKIPMSLIGSLLGLTEDVSPNVKYTIDYADEVEVVIYSVQARVINTIFKGRQNPGTYNLFWNGRDDKGKLMPHGDYIAEVRIGNTKFIRKRIVVN